MASNNPHPNFSTQAIPPVDQYIFVQGGTTPLPASTAQDHMRQGRYIYDRFGHPIEPTTWAPNAPFALQAATDRNHPTYDAAIHPTDVGGSFVAQVAWIEDVERHNIRAQTFTGSTKSQGRQGKGKGKEKAKQAPEYDNSRQGRVTGKSMSAETTGSSANPSLDWQLLYEQAVTSTSPPDTSAAYGSEQPFHQAQYHGYGIRQQLDAEHAAVGEPGPTYYTAPHAHQPGPVATAFTEHGTRQHPVARPPPIYIVPASAVSTRPQSSHQPQEPSPRLRLSSSHPSMRR